MIADKTVVSCCYTFSMAVPIISRQAVLELRGINPYVHITGEEAAELKPN